MSAEPAKPLDVPTMNAVSRILRLAPALVGVVVFGVACFDEADGFSGGDDTLLVPADVELDWDASHNAVDDGLGAVVPADVMVYDGASGEPRVGVTVELNATGDAHLLTATDLVAVDPEECLDCALFWDLRRDQYYALEVDLPATSVRVQTDDEGIARVYVLVDAMARRGADFSPVTVQVETSDADGAFSILP